MRTAWPMPARPSRRRWPSGGCWPSRTPTPTGPTSPERSITSALSAATGTASPSSARTSTRSWPSTASPGRARRRPTRRVFGKRDRTFARYRHDYSSPRPQAVRSHRAHTAAWGSRSAESLRKVIRARAGGTMTNLGALCAVALLLLTAPAWADATLRGVVVRDREHGPPMAGVELTAAGANPVTTGNDGQVVLAFPQGHPGQDVSVRVSRAGWEVVNDVLLDRPLSEPVSTHLFEIIVCASGEREQRRTEFYRLKGNQAVDQTYRTKLDELGRSHAATVHERDRLRRERDDARKQVDEWARQAAASKPDKEIGRASCR